MFERAVVVVDVGRPVAEQRTCGSCLCGAVSFTVRGPLRPVLACHCSQCRKTSGHYWAATAAPSDCVEITHEGALEWFQSSTQAQRGFCRRCGSSLFWRHASRDAWGIAAGALDSPTGLHTQAHIFFTDASDYYLIHPDEATIEGSLS